ncbi:DUF2913 family protein [Psychrobium sp. 1_MG-2023]|uniref:DUF2913 family protein n=1 Tax=Psychrobium sp. 1_MG-2023 TaxID=3062624 RepID=UPI000C31BC37|nr:DUF2913 family protein [Psychrobium sp. 1_MG-2023]MDP2559885.1 DUF2913 family protein [Psychrobium sp. 1_MG-2023]PKF59014.1 hypothetical protein CW748_02155 [Alteromonadales bacterium alter-6D02]
MMVMFKDELLRLVSLGLEELEKSQQSGKTPNNPLSENHFFSVWVSKAIKEQRFDKAVALILKEWQQQARTLGAGAQLKQCFSDLMHTYLNLKQRSKAESAQSNFEQLQSQLNEAKWQVSVTELHPKKNTIHSDGLSSFVVDESCIERAFDERGAQLSNISCFIRGDSELFIKQAYLLGWLAFKVSDYKSIVKFHGEYVLTANNNKAQLPEVVVD